MIADGTLVRLDDGRSVPVEDLLPGMTLHDPLRNIPLQVDCVLRRDIAVFGRSQRERARLAPVLLCKGALSEQRPSRNLLVSPQQQVLIRTMNRKSIPVVSLVSAKALVSGGRAARIAAGQGFTYHLIVTCTPGLMLAENVVLKTVGLEELAGTDTALIQAPIRSFAEFPTPTWGMSHD